MPLKINGYCGLSKPLDHNEPFEIESDNKTAEVKIDLQLSKQEKIVRAIDKERNSKMSSKSSITSIVKKELAKGDQIAHQKINEKNTFLALTYSKIIFFSKFKKEMII
jgi:hypothetical protein